MDVGGQFSRAKPTTCHSLKQFHSHSQTPPIGVCPFYTYRWWRFSSSTSLSRFDHFDSPRRILELPLCWNRLVPISKEELRPHLQLHWAESCEVDPELPNLISRRSRIPSIWPVRPRTRPSQLVRLKHRHPLAARAAAQEVLLHGRAQADKIQLPDTAVPETAATEANGTVSKPAAEEGEEQASEGMAKAEWAGNEPSPAGEVPHCTNIAQTQPMLSRSCCLKLQENLKSRSA